MVNVRSWQTNYLNWFACRQELSVVLWLYTVALSENYLNGNKAIPCSSCAGQGAPEQMQEVRS